MEEDEIVKRRDEAVRRALRTPPTPLKGVKKAKGKQKKRQDDRPSASSERQS